MQYGCSRFSTHLSVLVLPSRLNRPCCSCLEYLSSQEKSPSVRLGHHLLDVSLVLTSMTSRSPRSVHLVCLEAQLRRPGRRWCQDRLAGNYSGVLGYGLVICKKRSAACSHAWSAESSSNEPRFPRSEDPSSFRQRVPQARCPGEQRPARARLLLGQRGRANPVHCTEVCA